MGEPDISESTPQEIAELCAAIDRTIAKMNELREKMRRDDPVIEEARRRTRATLAEIAEVLAELKAA